MYLYKLLQQTRSLICFCLGILLIRFFVNQSAAYIFLLWNLFLAFIPLMLSAFMRQFTTKISSLKRISIFTVWLLFLPNSLYVITDFTHFFRSGPNAIWIDILLLFSFAFTSLLFGIMSIHQMLEIAKQKYVTSTVNILLLMTCLACGFGVYLGRVLRFNSWDVLTSPLSIIKTSLLSYTNTTAWLMTLGFGGFLHVAVLCYSRPSTKA